MIGPGELRWYIHGGAAHRVVAVLPTLTINKIDAMAAHVGGGSAEDEAERSLREVIRREILP